jgi:hypothetical protein
MVWWLWNDARLRVAETTEQEIDGKIPSISPIQGYMRKRSICVTRQYTSPLTDRYRLFSMSLGGAQPLLLILPWTTVAQGLMRAFLVGSTQSIAQYRSVHRQNVGTDVATHTPLSMIGTNAQ